jgi:hypothetical protein
MLPLLTKMKRSTSNYNEDELTLNGITNQKLSSPCKRLKFGVDTILGNVGIHSDNDSSFSTGNDSDDELKHKGSVFELID